MVTKKSTAHRRRYAALTCLGAIALCLSGCGSRSNGLTEVSGLITYNGTPLKEGFVSFVPTGNSGSSVSGTIGPDGRYELLQSRSAKGIAPGEYQIRIESWETPPGMGGGKPKHAMPEKYYLVNTSPLRATIGTEAAQTVDLVLED